MANPATATKRREVLRDGLDSTHVWAAFFTLMQMFDDMQKALVSSKWLIGDDYSIADTSLLSYVDRLERLGFEGLWATRTPKVSEWLLASKQRASYAEIENYIDPADAQKTRAEGQALWPEVIKKTKIMGFIEGARFFGQNHSISDFAAWRERNFTFVEAEIAPVSASCCKLREIFFRSYR